VEQDVESLHPAFLRLDGSSILEDPPEDDPEAAHLENPRIRTEWGGGVGLGDEANRWGANVAVRRVDYGDAGESGTSWQAEGTFQLTDGFTIRGSAGKGARLGDVIGQGVLENLASTDQEIHPLRDAEPENLEKWSAWQAELEWSRPSSWRALGRIFRAKGEDAYIWAPPTPWLYFDQGNISLFQIGEVPLFNTFDVLDVSTKGFEAEFTVPLPWNFRGLAWYRYLDAVEDDLTGKELPYLPSHYFLGQLRYARRFFPNRDMLLEVRYSGRFSGDRSTHGGETLSGYFVSDLLVQATIVNFTLFVSYKNLLNELYLLEEEFFLPGREGFLGINWRFHN
jgi:outer membrane receptor protein involved in Fe transport